MILKAARRSRWIDQMANAPTAMKKASMMMCKMVMVVFLVMVGGP